MNGELLILSAGCLPDDHNAKNPDPGGWGLDVQIKNLLSAGFFCAFEQQIAACNDKQAGDQFRLGGMEPENGIG